MLTVLHDSDARRRRRYLSAAVRRSLRDLSSEMSLLSHQIGVRLELADADLAALGIVVGRGPLSPSRLARQTGFHPATTTGILDRLERGGWVSRERVASDRRSVLIRFNRSRIADLTRAYAPMTVSLRQLCDGYTESELELIAAFLARAAAASRATAVQLSQECDPRTPCGGPETNRTNSKEGK
jgi:DNA-binding MarR family transcriptional regulator